jgi:uncharacterized RDD family membrane protein YckC
MDRSEERFAASLEPQLRPSPGADETASLRAAIAATLGELSRPKVPTGTAALRAAIDAEIFAARNPRVPTETRELRSAIATEVEAAQNPRVPTETRALRSAIADELDRVGLLPDDETDWDLASSSARTHGAVMNEPEWKQEVASRLANYRSRRGSRRPRHEGSLSLDFERAVNRMSAEEPADAPPVVSQAIAPSFEAKDAIAAEAPGTPQAELAPEPVAATNIIKFPRLPTLFEPFAPPSGDELAEPMIDRPRIIEAPEEVHCAQAPLAGIELEPEEAEVPAGLEAPLEVAPMGQRALAGVLDALMVALGTGMFLMIVLYRDVPAPQGKLGFVLVAALPAVLYAIYEYLFLVHGGRTPGMQMVRLAVSDFEGLPPVRRVRRVRALASVLSLCSLGLGLLWALLDEDTLCWHDRISRTYARQLAPEER